MFYFKRRIGSLLKGTSYILCSKSSLPTCSRHLRSRQYFPAKGHSTILTHTFGWKQQFKKVITQENIQHRRSLTSVISDDGKNGIIKWDDGRSSKFHSLWLISNCQCSSCIEKASNCRRYLPDVPLDVTIKDLRILENGVVRVIWNYCNHEGSFTTDFLKEHCYSEYSRRKQKEQIRPSYSSNLRIPKYAWPEVQQSEEILYKLLRHVNEEGIAKITDVPTEKGHILNVMKKFGNCIRTMYGEVYDLIAMKKATNIAYTSENLIYHADLQFYETAPGLQFFHCFRFDDSIIQGETLFIDMFHVLEEFKRELPEEFRILCEVPASFQRIHNDRTEPVYMIHRKPMINVNDEGDVIGFAYNPTSMAPALVKEENVEMFYRAYHLLYRKIENFPHVRSVRYKPGDVVCVNNRRFVHGRGKFDVNTGVRYLQGAYTNIDDFKSKVAVLSQKYDRGKPVKRVGNNDWL